MPNAGSPPFQYSKRAHMLGRLDGQMLDSASEERDRELEDFLAWLHARVGGLVIEGTIPTAGPPTGAQVPSKDEGDIWIDSNGNGWSWNGEAWVNIGPIRGPAGVVGPIGPPGLTGPQGTPGIGIPAGGTTGQVLAKETNFDYDAEWIDPPAGGGGGTGTDEVWIGPDDPIAAHPTIELWVDSDAVGGGGPGPSGPVAYVHSQGTVDDSWLVEHNLGFFPNVTVIDSGGATCEGDVGHIDENTLTVQFSAGFSGTAYLS